MKRRALEIGVFLFLFTAGTRAESRLNFPRLSFETHTFTGLAIVNPTASEATVTLTAYGEGGEMLSGVANPAHITVPAGQQAALLVSDLFPGAADPSTVAWVQATSAVDGLTGFFLFLDNTVTFFDGADLPLATTALVFNQASAGSGTSTELNVINPGNLPANLTLELVGTAPAPLTRTLTLPAMGCARLDLADFFGITQTPAGSYLKVTADQAVAGFELVRQAGGDLVGLNARSQSEQWSTLFFPQLAVLGGWQTTLSLINYSTQPAIVTLSARRPDGTLYDTAALQTNPVVASLEAGASLELDVATAFGFSGSQVLDGWLQVDSNVEAINGVVRYGVSSSGSEASVAGSGGGMKRAIFSHIATTQGFFTGLAILNSGQLATGVRVLALQQDGTLLGSFSTVLQPGERLARLLSEMIPQAANQGGGFIWVKSDLPVQMTSLFGQPAVLANIPPQAAPGSFNPDASLPQLTVSPSLAIVPPSTTQTFQASGSSGTVSWSVNGTPGGSATTGTIDSQGVYTAPATPTDEVVTVSASDASQMAGASVDVLAKDRLFSSLSLVESVAYLGTLSKLYTAELTVLGSAATTGTPAATPADSEIFEVAADGSKVPLLGLPGETISKMIAFRSTGGHDFLLAALQNTGRILRVDPLSGAAVEVASGLNQPTALVFDPETDELLVAQQDQISTIPRVQLEAGVSASTRGGPSTRVGAARLFPTTGAAGLAVDRCSGDLFFTDRQTGELRRFSEETGTTTLPIVFKEPTRLLALYRTGVPCPDSLHLLVLDRGLDRIVLFVPATQYSTAFAAARQGTDISFLRSGSPFAAGQASVLLPESVGADPSGGFDLSVVPVPKVYKNQPVNRPPQVTPKPGPAFGRVTVDLDFSAGTSRVLSCSSGTFNLQRTVTVTATAELSLRQGQPVLKGSFSGHTTQQCHGTGSFANESCESTGFEGVFQVEITPLSAHQDPVDLSGTWEIYFQGVDHGPSGDDPFSDSFTLQATQSGTQLSGSTAVDELTDELPADAVLSCSQPGSCTVTTSSESCQLVCDPATDQCATPVSMQGTLTQQK